MIEHLKDWQILTEFLNTISCQEWKKIIKLKHEYDDIGVIRFLRTSFSERTYFNMWSEEELLEYFLSQDWNEFIELSERLNDGSSIHT